ncbi:MAG: hypothetical protein QM704_23340 [Anaeromyxobacteraceae bacterium]
MRRALTSVGFARVLARLDADERRAPAAYEALRAALVRFFEWRGAPSPDEHADEALDRLAARLEHGADVEDVRGFALGIARHVLQEARRSPGASRTVQVEEGALDALRGPAGVDDEGPWLPCLEGCLSRLAPESQSLLLRYYEGRGQARIDRRVDLARELGVSEGALRSRVQRLRDGLERCVLGCAAAGDDRPTRIGPPGQG